MIVNVNVISLPNLKQKWVLIFPNNFVSPWPPCDTLYQYLYPFVFDDHTVLAYHYCCIAGIPVLLNSISIIHYNIEKYITYVVSKMPCSK